MKQSFSLNVLSEAFGKRNGQFEIDDDGQRNEILPCECVCMFVQMRYIDAFLPWEYSSFMFSVELRLKNNT